MLTVILYFTYQIVLFLSFFERKQTIYFHFTVTFGGFKRITY